MAEQQWLEEVLEEISQYVNAKDLQALRKKNLEINTRYNRAKDPVLKEQLEQLLEEVEEAIIRLQDEKNSLSGLVEYVFLEAAEEEEDKEKVKQESSLELEESKQILAKQKLEENKRLFYTYKMAFEENDIIEMQRIFKLVSRAAEEGEADKVNLLGNFYNLERVRYGKKINRIFQKNVEQNYPASIYNLATCYEYGRFCEENMKHFHLVKTFTKMIDKDFHNGIIRDIK